MRHEARITLSTLALLALACVLFSAPSTTRADDVNDEVRAAYTAGSKFFREGGRANLEKAFRLLNTRKDEALDSVDYWELYARVWLALDKVPRYLWVKTIGARQEKTPGSPVFDLVRARVEVDPKEKRKHIDAALKRKPDSIRAKAMLALLLLEEEDEEGADELMEEVLAKDPDNARCLVGKARLALSDGLADQALEMVARALKNDDSGFLHHLQSLAYRRKARSSEEKGLLEKALAAADQALRRDPAPEHARNYDELLQETGDPATAAKALSGHFERTKLPLLGALMAKSAFAAGDYAATVLGLGAVENPDAGTLRGLAVAYARLGKSKEMRRATKKLAAQDGRLLAAEFELALGDAKAAAKRLGTPKGKEAQALLARIHAWAGRPKAIHDLVGEDAATGTRTGEDLLLASLQAQVIEAMGRKAADEVRKSLLAARAKAGRESPVQATFTGAGLGTLKTEGWARRAVSYWLTPCGRPYRDAETGFGSSIVAQDEPNVVVGVSVNATSDCKEHAAASFPFNTVVKKGFVEALKEAMRALQTKLADFEPAQQAFAAASAACLAGDRAEAVAKFDEALAVEPGWHRPKVFKAVVQALESKDQRMAAAEAAAKVVEAWPTDLEARRLVVFLRAWAGHAGLQDEIDALADTEARYNERDLAEL